MAGKLMDDVDGGDGGGSNLTPESFLEVVREWREVRREQSASATAVARVGKKMKALGIQKEPFDIFIKLSDMEPEEAVSLLKSVIRFGKWASRPFAAQTDLFRDMAVEVPKAKAAAEFSEFEIEDTGFIAGFKGQKIDDNPYSPEEPDHPGYAVWRIGWNKGQAERVRKSFGGDKAAATSTGGERVTGRRGRPPGSKNKAMH